MKKGFTLMEVLAAVFLLGLLALVLLPQLYQGRLLVDRAQEAQANFQDQRNLIEAMKNNGYQGRPLLDQVDLAPGWQVDWEEKDLTHLTEVRIRVREGGRGRENTWLIYLQK